MVLNCVRKVVLVSILCRRGCSEHMACFSRGMWGQSGLHFVHLLSLAQLEVALVLIRARCISPIRTGTSCVCPRPGTHSALSLRGSVQRGDAVP